MLKIQSALFRTHCCQIKSYKCSQKVASNTICQPDAGKGKKYFLLLGIKSEFVLLRKACPCYPVQQ